MLRPRILLALGASSILGAVVIGLVPVSVTMAVVGGGPLHIVPTGYHLPVDSGPPQAAAVTIRCGSPLIKQAPVNDWPFTGMPEGGKDPCSVKRDHRRGRPDPDPATPHTASA